jgi:ATP-dependent DNA helicase Rep
VTQLNPRQREAIRHVGGPLLVLAGAGSGKTRVITEKIAFLIKQKLFDAERIAAITFTNKAANEMRARLKSQRGAPKPWISTFHTLGLRILRAEFEKLGYRTGFSIMDSKDCENLVADILRRSPANDLAEIRAIQNRISSFKSALITPDQALRSALDDPLSRLAATCYLQYDEALKAFNSVDFDDLIMRPVSLLKSDVEVCTHWRGEIKYLLVDEYQDTNVSQYELVRALVGEKGSFTIVGDDDQSIYAWRGARPENLAALQTDFPQLKIIKLEQNYRSVGTILNAANHLIANNPHVFEKRLWSERGYGEKIKVNGANDEHEEVYYVANEILHQRMIGNRKFGDYAVLFRSNHQARLFERAFREREIPYQLSGGRSFFDYTEIKDIVCYLRVIANPDDDSALLRIINTPRRGLGMTTVKKLVALAGDLGSRLVQAGSNPTLSAQLSSRAAKTVEEFFAWIVETTRSGEQLDPAGVAAQIIADIEYRDWIERTSESETDAKRRLDNVNELLEWIARIHAGDSSKTMQDIVASLTLFDILERKDDEEIGDKVALMTFHAAKGLEFPHVFLAGMEENILPHKSSIEEDSIEEERRVAYVGITRAQQSLTLSYARSRRRYGQIEECEPSRFIAELPANDLSWVGKNDSSPDGRVTGNKTLSGLKQMLQTP